MILKTVHETLEKEVVYFGINDFYIHEENVEIWFHRTVDTDYDGEGGMLRKSATVKYAIEEGHKTDVDLIEMIADYTQYDDVRVVVGISTKVFGETVRAVNQLLKDDESGVTATDIKFIGDTTPIHL